MNKLSLIRKLTPVIIIVLLLFTLAPAAIQATSGTVSVSVTSSPNPSYAGQEVLLTATVEVDFTSPPPGTFSVPHVTGTVTFFDGATPIGTATLGSGTDGFGVDNPEVGGPSILRGTAVLTVDNLIAGSHNITGTYSGNYPSNTSPPYNQQVIAVVGVGGEVAQIDTFSLLIPWLVLGGAVSALGMLLVTRKAGR
jgi:hypothetical protein